ncbi:MAG: hypothetical protein J6Q76_02635 [Clostridia bacterium]|nr:hypothetical protein [Clostridia bacterium]
MKNFKRVLSVIIVLSIMLTTFSFLSIFSVTAVTAPEGYEIDEQIKIDFNTDGRAPTVTQPPCNK